MTDRRLCEDVFRSMSEKVSVHSSEIFDEGVLLGFRAPTTFEARQMSPGEPQLFITISRDEMDEVCSYWQASCTPVNADYGSTGDLLQANHVWCADITYIPMQKGFLYLVAVMEWATRHVLSWRLSNTMDADFCVEALKEVIDTYGPPKIFNTDQGSQFTCGAFIEALTDAEVAISMDGRGRYLDNIFIERLWRSLKYEAIYLTEMSDGFKARRVIDD